MGASGGFDEFRAALFDRHVHPLTSGLSTVSDALGVSAVALGVARRDARLFGGLAAAAFVTAVVAHVFQPGTLRDELRGVLRHPVWATRAEYARVVRRAPSRSA